MKKLLFLVLILSICSHIYATDDIIVTNANRQIPCKVQAVSGGNVTYIRTDNNTENTIAASDIRVLQLNSGDKQVYTSTELQSLELQVKTEIQPQKTVYIAIEPQAPETVYIAPEPQVPETIYIAPDPQPNETIYIQEPAPTPTSQPTLNINFDNKRLAIAESYAGVYVFNDNTPISEYEIIGEVACSQLGSSRTSVAVSPFSGDMAIGISSTPSAQYPSLRNALISKAILANRDVQGIIIKTPREGEATATMIKFKNKDANNALAKVNVHFGLMVFSDCKPYYEYIGINRLKASTLLKELSYTYIRDNILKKTSKKKENINGIIIHLVDGGRDYAETITIH